MRLLLAAGVIHVSLVLAAPKQPAIREGDGFRITLAPTWLPQPEIERQVTAGLPPDVVGGALAFGDTSANAALQIMWVETKAPSPKPAREELEAFHETLKSYLENSGSKTTAFKLSEKENRMTARHTFEGSGDPRMTTLQVSSAGVTTAGLTRSWSAQCVWSTPKGKQVCETAMAQFKVTEPAASFQKLPAPTPKPKEKKK